MKKILALCIILMLPVLMAAGEKTQIKFDTTRHDFGTIKADGGTVTAEYRYTNTGKIPLVIDLVGNGGCGCTKPSYPKEPLAPGKSAVIKIHFNPAGRAGQEVNREIKIKANTKPRVSRIYFSAAII